MISVNKGSQHCRFVNKVFFLTARNEQLLVELPLGKKLALANQKKNSHWFILIALAQAFQ
jgi:hypothetical protein